MLTPLQNLLILLGVCPAHIPVLPLVLSGLARNTLLETVGMQIIINVKPKSFWIGLASGRRQSPA
jgi:hypothetical protein